MRTNKTAGRKIDSNDPINHRIPTFQPTSTDLSDLVTDAHRTLLTLPSIQFEPNSSRAKYNINLIKNYGKHMMTTSRVNLATARNKSATDELLDSGKTEDAKMLDEQLTSLMKMYKVDDRLLVMDLHRKNTRLLFHFLHFVENNGALDPIGNLHVRHRDVVDLVSVINEALRVKANESGGKLFAKKGFFSTRTMTGTTLETVGKRLFTMSPYITLDLSLVRRLNRKNGFRSMLLDWSTHGNLFWNIMDFTEKNGYFSKGNSPLSEFSLYVFMPTYIYLTREIRNLIPHLEKSLIETMDELVFAHESFQSQNANKMYDVRTSISTIVRGLIFGIQKEVLQSSETNVFLMRIKTKTGYETHWLFAHWHRKYVLYDIGNNVQESEAGLKTLLFDSTHKQKRVNDLLDDQVYMSSQEMLDTVRRFRQNATGLAEHNTTLKQEIRTNETMRQRRSSMRHKFEKFTQVNGEDALGELRTKQSLDNSITFQKAKV